MHFLHRFDILKQITLLRPMITRLILVFLSFFLLASTVSAAPLDTNVRETTLGTTGSPTTLLDEFTSPIREFFFTPGAGGGE